TLHIVKTMTSHWENIPVERQQMVRGRLIEFVTHRCPEYLNIIDATLYCHRENLGPGMWAPLFKRYGSPPWGGGKQLVFKSEMPNPFDAVSVAHHQAVASYAKGAATYHAVASDANSAPVPASHKRHVLEPPS